jgi:hypothetical protein
MLGETTPGTRNREDWEARFAAMSDKDFEQLMRDIQSDQADLYVTMPTFSKEGSVDTRTLISVGKKLGHDFFQRIWVGSEDGKSSYLSPVPYLVTHIPVRRVSQTLTKKMSVPDNSRVIDTLTGQPTGESKGAKISWPELQLTSAMGLNKALIELVKYRGGDIRGYNALSGMLSKFGKANIDSLSAFASGVESLKTLKTILTCCHLKNTL